MDKPKIVPSAPKDVKDAAETKSAQSKASEAKEVKSTVVTQREAVYMVITKVLRDEKVLISPNVAVKTLLTDAHLKKIYVGIADGLRAKKVALKETDSNKKKLADPKKLEVYVIGLVNNWLKRDPRLNGKSSAKK